MFGYLIVHPGAQVVFYAMIAIALRHRRQPGAPHRRRRHAGGHLAAQLLRRPGRLGHRLRHRQQPPDHRRRARRRLGLHPLDHHVQGDEPVVRQRALRRLRRGARERRPRSCRRDEGDLGGGRGAAAGLRAAGHRGAGLRPGGGAGPAGGARAGRPGGAAGRGSEVRHSSGGRPHAGPHERAPRRGEHSLREAARHGGDQPRVRRAPTSRWSSAPTTW